jgi:hypothetical protein
MVQLAVVRLAAGEPLAQYSALADGCPFRAGDLGAVLDEVGDDDRGREEEQAEDEVPDEAVSGAAFGHLLLCVGERALEGLDVVAFGLPSGRAAALPRCGSRRSCTEDSPPQGSRNRAPGSRPGRRPAARPPRAAFYLGGIPAAALTAMTPQVVSATWHEPRSTSSLPPRAAA